MDLNVNQKTVIALGMAAMVAMIIFPPKGDYASAASFGGLIERVDAARLAIQELVTLCATCGVALILKDWR